MKTLLRVMILVILWFALLNMLSISKENPSESVNIYENKAYSLVTPAVKAVAVVPDSIVLVVNDKHVSVKTEQLGISVASNLTLKINYAQLNKSLDRYGVNSSASSMKLLAKVSRGSSEVVVTAKPKPKPQPKEVPDAIVAPTPAPKPVTPAPVKPVGRTITYCLRTRGVDEAYLGELRAKLAQVYSDSRGWSLGGANTFIESSSSCSLVVWLTAADQMSTFGAICDSMWSCTVYPNVILNFDRWQNGSPAWNASGSGLDDYRTMVINHETGHWFGFGHRFCQGAGQAAPVMQQQSISLQGCAPNPWPLDYEKAAL